jgi:hypothetical protein
MTGRLRLSSRLALAGLAFVSGLAISDVGPGVDGFHMSQAQARFGRPLTPMSFAGVARRTTRRAFYGAGYGYGAAAVGAYGAAVVGPACYEAVDAWGRIYTRC